MAADPVHSASGMSSLVLQAAQSAAAADGLAAALSPPQRSEHNHTAPPSSLKIAQSNANGRLRRGKWTPEEEAYANRLIQEFKSGLLPLTDGTTLRTFLSKLLNCDPMRISKKFVGSNCIGKQVFRRRNADLNRLTPEQISKSRAELSELERRFLERVTQTNRVKTNGVGGQPSASIPAVAPALSSSAQASSLMMDLNRNSALMNHNNTHQGGHSNNNNNNSNNFSERQTPPWMQPPIGYKHGQGQAFAQAHLSGATNARAAAAGRALLEGLSGNRNISPRKGGLGLQRNGSTDLSDLLLLQGLQQRVSQQNLFDLNGSNGGNSGIFGRDSHSALAQLAQNRRNQSFTNLMLKTGLSREQLVSQLARESAGGSGGMANSSSFSRQLLNQNRQNSFDALMSLDFQSLQSIDNLANLMQNSHGGSFPETGMKNADFGGGSRSNGDLSTAARRLASAGRMESLLKNISSNNIRGGGTSSATLSNLLHSAGGNLSAASLLANSASAASLANLLRQDSSTGLSALRMQDGLNNRNSSVDDFLSLVAAGDIPHQDPNLLNVPLLHQQQQQGNINSETAKFLAQHQQLLASGMSNSALANALASRGSLGSSLSNLQQAVNNNSTSAAALALAQARVNEAKRKLDDLSGELSNQGTPKRGA